MLTDDILLTVLNSAWSLKTSSKWSIENPAKGQCGVTSLIINDLLGGEIAKTDVSGEFHFYNLINGRRVDFTDSQFPAALEYDDIPSSRAEALLDTSQDQYMTLKAAMEQKLSKLYL
ncbi:hypothetical protein [Agrobacterium larrymoorei]|uniref:YunG n=1 Tax=Agrobacterium larrymoorei TaxID=160699 RepID=A0AAF0HF48_9HYPH|nr:hypothetical protein [Agrobacterium larrymoorei]WHA43386.1 hypothetical protein CFBP5477_019300 [Agrobacterium larrymoorei]